MSFSVSAGTWGRSRSETYLSLGLNYNRVVLKSVPGIKKELEEVVLSCTQDTFFSKHRYANFGDLGTAVKDLLDEYQSRRYAKFYAEIPEVPVEGYQRFKTCSSNWRVGKVTKMFLDLKCPHFILLNQPD
jgi:hypothetical protein